MAPTDRKTDGSRGDESEPDLWYSIPRALLFPCVFYVLLFYVLVISRVLHNIASVTLIIDDDKPMTSSVEVVSVQGLEPAIAPGAASPAFNLLVRVHNNGFHDQCRAGGDVVVSYAGVPLAHGRTPSFFLGAWEAVTMAVNATSEGVGIPEDLFRLMSAERRQGVAQLDIGMQLGWTGWDRESYTWSVDLDE